MNEIVPRTVAVYMRTSSDEQAKNETIEIQRNYLAMYVELHEHTVYRWYADDGVTGTLPLGDRPAGRELLRDAKLGLFSAVLVYKVDRFGRKMLVILDAHQELERAGVAFVSARESGIETTTSTGRAFFQLMGVFAELERSTILERMTGGKSKKARGGQWVTGRVPYGYEVIDGLLIPSAAEVGGTTEAELIRSIFRQVADGATTHDVVRTLNTSGTERRASRYGNGTLGGTQGGVWNVQAIASIVRNPVYRGEYTFRSRMRKAKLVGEPVRIEVPPLVLDEIWQQANERMSSNRFSGGPARFEYLLKGLMRCSLCGYLYAGAGYEKYRYYQCGQKFHRVPGVETAHCPNPRLRAAEAEQAMVVALERIVDNAPAYLARLPIATQVDTSAQVAAKRAELDRLGYLFQRGGVSRDQYDQRKAEVDGELERLRKQKKPVDVAGMLADLPQDLQVIEAARVVLLRVIERVEVRPEAPRIKVQWIGGVEEWLL